MEIWQVHVKTEFHMLPNVKNLFMGTHWGSFLIALSKTWCDINKRRANNKNLNI